MEYQNIINLLDNKPNQHSKFRTKNWIEINDDSRGTSNTNSQIKFKTSMLRSGLCDYSDACILVSGTITITGARSDDAEKRLDERNPLIFTDRISQINNTQIDNAKYIDLSIPMQNLMKHSNNYSKTLGNLWKHYRDDPNDNITKPESFKFKIKIKKNKTPAAGNTQDIEIRVSLKYLSSFQRFLEMLLINCEINLISTWSDDCFIFSATGAANLK